MNIDGKANTLKTTFSRETSVGIKIRSKPLVVWNLLTKASDFPRWNSTVISMEGEIKAGETIKLKSTLAPERIFKLKVKEFEPEKRLAWGDGKGTRVYTITDNGDETLTFKMTEKIGD